MNETDHDMHDESISHIYQQSRVEEPSMKLDSIILSQGRKAVEKKKGQWQGMRWMLPLSSFALAMLTVTLFIQMKQEHPEILEPSPVSSPALQIEEELKDDIQNDLRKKKITADKEQSEKSDAAGALAPIMEMKSAPTEMEVAPARSLRMMPNEPLKQEQKTMGASQSRSRESLSEADSATPSQPKVLKRQTSLDPETWIVKIRNLLKQKNRDQAIKELEAFKAIYPDYQLPDDLQALNK